MANAVVQAEVDQEDKGPAGMAGLAYIIYVWRKAHIIISRITGDMHLPSGNVFALETVSGMEVHFNLLRKSLKNIA